MNNRKKDGLNFRSFGVCFSLVLLFLFVYFPVVLYQSSSTPKIREPLIIDPPEEKTEITKLPAKLTPAPTKKKVTSPRTISPTNAPTSAPTNLPTVASTKSETFAETKGKPITNREAENVAFVITLVKEGKIAYFDAAVVLAKSIALNFKYNYSLYAVVHENVKHMDFTLLKKFGWIIRVVPTPVKLSEIETKHDGILLKELPKSGCCGEVELIKFEAWKLTDHTKVILLDADVILTKEDAFANYIELLKTNDLIFNFDRGVGAPLKGKDNIYNCVSAGFIMLKPSLDTYKFFIDTVKGGDWGPGVGWGGSGMGWCYGGPTLQGLIAYYVHLHFNSSIESDSCRANTIGNQFNYRRENCSSVEPKSIEMFHFSVCVKPWECAPPPSTLIAICTYVTDKWWEYRNLVEKELNIAPTPSCVNKGPYIDITQAYVKATGKNLTLG